VLSVMQIFKIIFGVILSAFILMIILRFSSSYTEIGESSKEVEILIGLKKTIQDVYTTGISTDFEVRDLEEAISFYSPPNIETPVTSVNLDPVPTFLVPGESVSVHRNEYDLGWFKFYYIHALPETKIIFVPLGKSEVVWNTVGNITKHFPSTENTKTKVLFGIGCNDTGGQPIFFFSKWERDYFIRTVLPWLYTNEYEFVPCGKREGYRMITVTETPIDADFQVVPIDNEMGYVHVNNTMVGQKTYLYKNPIDIVALFFGGEKMYDYTNEKFLKELSIASDLASRESSLLRSKSTNPYCDTLYQKFIQVLGSLRNRIDNGDYTNEDDMREFSKKIKESVEAYKQLEEMGC
jgi:hypothetical protein